MITTISAIEFLAVIVLSELNTKKEKVINLTYPELREKADLIEEEFPSIQIDLRKVALDNFQFIDDIGNISIQNDNISIQTNDKTKEIMELYCPSQYIYQKFSNVITH